MLALAFLAVLYASPALAVAEAENEDKPFLRYDLSLEYRLQHIAVRNLSVNDLTAQRIGYFDQRGRTDVTVHLGDHVNVRVMLDLLDGVLFGDNGSFIGEPARNRGARIAAKSPNLATLQIGQIDPNGNSVDRDNYGFTLVPAAPVIVRSLYGEATLPLGVLRAGRQILARSRNVLINPGDRSNRWGISREPETIDGIAFGTKLSAVADAIAGNPIDADRARGLFIGGMFGQVVEQLPQVNDDVTQLAGALYYLDYDRPFLGIDVDKLDTGLSYSNRFGPQFASNLHTVNVWLNFELERFHFSAYHLHMIGRTREVSEGLALLGLAAGAPTRQDIKAFGGFVDVGYDFGPVELILELFYASGDDTPESTQPINQLTFARDTNVGLHLFENVVHYQTARSAAVGVANLGALGPPSFPVAEVNTRGSLQNGVVLFPQAVASPLDWLDVRAGVLFAWSQVPVVDPITTILRGDGTSVEDDKVNFAGGKPASYWGTEIDVGLTLKPVPGFLIDLEGALLFPGPALEDEHGDAVKSYFGNIRLTYFYDA